MRFTVVTILPELIEPALKAGVVGRASEAGTIVVDTVNPRDFTHDRHRTVDDTPYGGGPGMVMKVEPLLAAIAKASEPRPPSSPTGAVARISESPMRSLGARMLEDVKSTLSEIADGLRATPKRGGSVSRSVPDHTIRKLDQDASLDAAAAEDTLAALEQELRQGAEPAPSPSTAPARTSATAGEELLAELEMELGMRPPAADLTTTARARDQKILGPADEEPSTLPGRPPLGPDTPVAGPARPSLGPDTPARPSLGPDTPARPSVGPDTPARPSAGPDTPARPSAGPDNRPETGRPHRILMSPSGRPLTQARVRELATLDHLVLVCGRYEGIDQRVIDTAIDEEISIGDYVLSGGELAALVVIDAVARYVPGVLGEAASTDEESFSAGLLEYPHYTRPQTLPASAVPEALRREALADQTVPAVLQSGNHAAIASWRRQQSLERTAIRRPDLFRQVRMTKADRKLYAPLAARTHLALVHHPVVDRAGAVITTALTNFDIHDLARSTMTYGLAGYHIVTPITSQREKAANIATLWMGDEKGEHRAQALRLVRTAESLDAVIATLATEHAQPPIVVATSAKPDAFAGRPRRTSSELVAEATLSSAPVLLVLGTGWGLAEDLIPSVSRVLAPIEGDSNWNHLSVRSAAAIILDRLFGRPA